VHSTADGRSQARSADPATGFCIILSPNAIRILRALSIDLVAADAARPLTHTRFRSATGSLLLSGESGSTGSFLTVERGKMIATLLRRLGELGGRVAWEHKLVGFTTDASRSHVEVAFAGGARATGSLLVGADGTWSTVRRGLPQPHAPLLPPWSLPLLRLLSPLLRRRADDAWMPQPTRWTALYGISPPLPSRLITAHGALQLYMRAGRPGAYATYSLAGGRLFWVCYESSAPSRTPFSACDAERARDEFAGAVYGEDADGTLADVVTGSGRIAKVRLWHAVFENTSDGRAVLLLGDAAHPQTTFLGQGAGRGIEEGAELRRALLREAWGATGVGVGVAGFVDGARRRGRDVANGGWWAGCLVMGDWWWSRTARDWLLAYLSWREKRTRRTAGGTTAPPSVEPRKPRDHWLFDYCVPAETEEEFRTAQRLLRAEDRDGKRGHGCSAPTRRVMLYALAVLLGVALLFVGAGAWAWQDG